WTRDVWIREDPAERLLRVRTGFAAELRQVRVLRALERLHGDDRHVVLLRLLEDVAERRPHAEVARQNHHVETAGVDRSVRDLFEVRRVRRYAEEARLALLLQAIERLMDVRCHEAVD